MYQSFDVTSDPEAARARVALLRERLAALGVDALIVPRADEFQGEYVSDFNERLAWITGFTGSAGSAVIGARKAALFVDGRYRVQARQQVDTRLFEVVELPGNPTDWIKATFKSGARVGYWPWVMTVAQAERTEDALSEAGITLTALRTNPVDAIWSKAERYRNWRERSSTPARIEIAPHPVTHAGRSAKDKIADVQKRLKADGQDALILTAGDGIAWLFNIRGSDVPHTPVVLAYAIVHARSKAELFVDPVKVGKAARAHLEPVAAVHPIAAFGGRLDALKAPGTKVRLNPATCPSAIARRLGSGRRIARASDPTVAMKARKTETEIRGAREAHRRDGVAMCRFLAWLDRAAPAGGIDEIAAVTMLEAMRVESGALKEISFDTISGSGPNGAIVHYRVTYPTNRTLAPGELFLIDSGGQYADGTTDVTRTVAIGEPTAEMAERFTLVLKGHIAVATAVFPVGTRGVDLDPFARRALWAAGLDYDHGTGHGVGSYLSVHEGPASISRAGMERLEPGMILSNEPGYYRDGAYGIRIENLVLVTPPARPAGGDRDMLAFETLTLAPIDRRLVVKAMLDDDERGWLDAYHARVREEIAPLVDAETRRWLDKATRKL